MPARWTLPQARRAATASPWTKELRHLEPLPKHWSDRRKVPGALQNVTRPKDRIKWWNIVPGDQVKIRNSRINEILEVAQINKLTNMVYLKVRVWLFAYCYIVAGDSHILLALSLDIMSLLDGVVDGLFRNAGSTKSGRIRTGALFQAPTLPWRTRVSSSSRLR